MLVIFIHKSSEDVLEAINDDYHAGVCTIDWTEDQVMDKGQEYAIVDNTWDVCDPDDIVEMIVFNETNPTVQMALKGVQREDVYAVNSIGQIDDFSDRNQ